MKERQGEFQREAETKAEREMKREDERAEGGDGGGWGAGLTSGLTGREEGGAGCDAGRGARVAGDAPATARTRNHAHAPHNPHAHRRGGRGAERAWVRGLTVCEVGAGRERRGGRERGAEEGGGRVGRGGRRLERE